MKAINIQIENGDLYTSLPNEYESKIKIKNNYALDEMNLNTVTIDDLSDYFLMGDYEEYIFVIFGGNGIRLKTIINEYLSEFSQSVTVKTIDEVSEILPDSAELKIDLNSIKKNLPKRNEAVQNGYIAQTSIIYPNNLGKGVLKHLFVDSKESVKNITHDLLIHMAINSSIILNNFIVEIPGFITLNSKTFKQVNNKIINVSNEQLEQSMTEFIATGKINNHLKSSYILDYGETTGINKMNSLVINEKGFSFSHKKKYSPDLNANASYMEILNMFSMYERNHLTSINNSDFFKLFPMLIEFKNNMNISEFNTPFNQLNYPNVSAEEMPKWIGFKTNSNYYAFNLQINKLFEVDKLFYFELEKVLKGINENTSQQKEVRALLNNVK